jgi:hypothetical protein
MKNVSFIIAAMALSTLSLPAESDQFLCISDKATGFRYDVSSKSWHQSRFNPILRYVIYPPGKDATRWRSAKYILKVVGTVTPIAYCSDADNETPNQNGEIIRCTNFSIELIFNKKNGRFSAAMQGDSYYADGTNIEGKTLTDETADTPTLQIGTCFAF